MKKLVLLLIMLMAGILARAQQEVKHMPVRFQIHKERCMLRHERNGIRHDFRKFHRYQHFRHKMRKLHRHRMIKRAIR